MVDLLERASIWLEDQRTAHAAQTVTYERGLDTVDLAASLGRTVFEIENGDGAVERWESRDFLLRTADLVLAGGPTLPERGDRIRWTQGASTAVYEVMSPGNEPHFRFSDPYRKALRVHTKLVEAA